MSYKFVDPEHSLIQCSDGRFIPCDLDNETYLKIVKEQLFIEPWVESTPTVEDVKMEAERRIIVLCGASDLQKALVKQMNMNMRASQLNDIRHDRELTPSEKTEAEALKAFAQCVSQIRSASNEIEAMSIIPNDYRDDARWE